MENQVAEPYRIATLKAVVRGRVQGVGYRMFVVHSARGLRLHGYVKNQPDRSVYVEASGPRPVLERLLVLLRDGPTGARVSEVTTEWLEAANESLAAEFEVRF